MQVGFGVGSHPRGQLGGLAAVLTADTYGRNARPGAVPALAPLRASEPRGAGHPDPGLSQNWAAPAGKMVPSPGITGLFPPRGHTSEQQGPRTLVSAKGQNPSPSVYGQGNRGTEQWRGWPTSTRSTSLAVTRGASCHLCLGAQPRPPIPCISSRPG